MSKKYLDDNGLLYFWGKLKAAFVAEVSWDSTNKKLKRTKNGSTSDLVTLADVALSGSYNDLLDVPAAGVSDVTVDGTSVVGAGGVAAIDLTGKVPTTRKVNGKALSADITLAASDVSAIPTSAKGAASGVCPLGADSKVDSQYLPSYIDDVIEAYPISSATELSAGWLSLTQGGSALTPESGKIYVLMAASTSYDTNSQFRWGGTAYVKLSDGGVSSITNGEIDVIVGS